jgi:phosphoserine aminotransferase
LLGRSHRSKIGKAKLKRAIDLTREVLAVPADYRIGIVPASDTGAVEMALWSLLGPRPSTMLAWESFGEGWVTDVVKQLKLKDARVLKAPYGELPDLKQVDTDPRRGVHLERHDLGRARAEWRLDRRRPQGPDDLRRDLGRFAQPLDFDKLDVVTFSWQKALGGEAAHGMLILSPRAVARLESYKPPWPMPKIFRMTKGGKLIEGIFEGETINTPSMLCVEDYLDALEWAKSIGGLPADEARADANLAKAIADWVAKTPWIDFLARDRRTAPTRRSACRRRSGGAARAPDAQAAFVKAIDARSRRRASPTTSAPIATRRRACASGAARRSSLRRRSADAVARLGLRAGQGALPKAASA